MPRGLTDRNEGAQTLTWQRFMPRPVLASEAGGLGGSLQQKPRLLIVEDDYFTAAQYQAALESAGHEVVGIAANFEEAVRIADAERPELVIMDIRLAGPQDGIEAATEIRERFGVPSLFVSAFVDSATRERAEAASPLGWLAKPFIVGQLIDCVRETIERLRSSSQ